MIGYRGSYEHPQSVFDRIGQPGRQMLVNEREPPVSVGGHELDEDRVLVGEVLVQRPDRNLCPLGNAICGTRRIAEVGENVSSRLQDASAGRLRTVLSGLLARL